MKKSREREKKALVQHSPERSPDQQAVIERVFADLELPNSSSAMTKTAKASRKDRKRKQRSAASPGDEGKILDRVQIDGTLCDIYLLDAHPDASQREPAVSPAVSRRHEAADLTERRPDMGGLRTFSVEFMEQMEKHSFVRSPGNCLGVDEISNLKSMSHAELCRVRRFLRALLKEAGHEQ